jgi:hypothetical protein
MVFVYTIGLKPTNQEKEQLNKRFKQAKSVYNLTLKELLKRNNKMKKDPLYKKAYKLPKGSERNEILKDLDKVYGLEGKFTGGKIASEFRKTLNLEDYLYSTICQKLGFRAWLAFSKMKFANGANRVNFSEQINSLISGYSDQGIYLDGDFICFGIKRKKKTLIKIKINFKRDQYEDEVFKNKLLYWQLIRKKINGKENYYLQAVMDGIAPGTGLEGGRGSVGIDIGTSTIAVSSEVQTELEELFPDEKRFERACEIARLNRSLERKRRATNPENYNEDGTIKAGKKTWKYSPRYKRDLKNLSELKRKEALSRNLAHRTLAKKIVSYGDRFVVEEMNFMSLSKRAKETKVNEKTGKFQSKKRFGSTIGHRAPGLLIAFIQERAEKEGKTFIKADTRSVKASQLDHTTGEYIKVSLSTRTKKVDNFKVQRDLYSAFLLQHVKDDKKTVDLELCSKNFERFLSNQERTMRELETSLSSTGKTDFFKDEFLKVV